MSHTDPRSNLPPVLRIDGEVQSARTFSYEELAALDPSAQVPDVGQIDPNRKGAAVRIAALLDLVGASAAARYVGLHASRDNFHASIPLEAIRDRALVIYSVDGRPLPMSAGGPFRFFIPDHLACHAHEIDECANVKFVEHIELTRDKGFDNRPHDDAAHAALHKRE